MVDLYRKGARPEPLGDLIATASGRTHRDDPVRGRTGGPAGNARLSSWTGLVLLVLLAVEGATLLALGSLLGVHILVGAVVVPPVLLKTATTGWRFLRYYSGDRDYRLAGPPPLLLRILGPLVIVSTLAVLGSGLGLVVMGADGPRPLVGAGGLAVSMTTLHKASFIVWFAAMTAHVLARTVPALKAVGSAQSRSRQVSGGPGRLAVLGVSLSAGVLLGVLTLASSSWWTTTWVQH